MKFAVIAAGEGSRLSKEGVEIPKPLVRVNQEPMIDRLFRIFVENGATEIIVIINECSKEVREHLEKIQISVPLRIVVQTTPSSMHSLYVISSYLRDEPFCLTTVDTIFKEKEFSTYLDSFKLSDVDGYMAVTSFVDDEKPLYVAVNENNTIIDFHDVKSDEDKYVSGGIYCLKPNVLNILDDCISQGMSRMRNFQRQMIVKGLQLVAFPFDKIIDVDHKVDIEKAELFLSEKKYNSPLHLVGINRGSKYSPNMASDDAAILEAVAKNLSSKGCIVEIYSETNFIKENIKGDFIFNMARDKNTILRLQQFEKEGALIINSGFGIANCIRQSMTEILINKGIPHPRSWIVELGNTLPKDLVYPCWMKRGDSSAIVKEDVCYVTNRDEAEKILLNFWDRKINVVIINEHLQGDLIKFYGVQGTDFFYWFYPSVSLHTKFGLEVINGEAKGYPFSVELLKLYADKAAEALNVPIYGGDCVVLENGDIKIFDFNDWPSFSPCREKAAYKIAEYIWKRIKKYIKY